MPYIQTKDREALEPSLTELTCQLNDKPGELNYLITRLVKQFLTVRFCRTGNIGYTDLNEVYGVLMAAAAEFYRRKVVPYEETKIKENGDVY